MNKLLRIISSAVVTTACIGSFASAEPCSGATIVDTGPNSNNVIGCSDVNTLTISCMNNVLVGTTNIQNGASGAADNSDNTVTGFAQTGTVANYNNTSVQLGITGCGQESAVTPPVAPVIPAASAETPGGGEGGASAPETPGGEGSASELPNTSSTPIATAVAGGAAVLSVLALSSRFAIEAYRRFAIK